MVEEEEEIQRLHQKLVAEQLENLSNDSCVNWHICEDLKFFRERVVQVLVGFCLCCNWLQVNFKW